MERILPAPVDPAQLTYGNTCTADGNSPSRGFDDIEFLNGKAGLPCKRVIIKAHRSGDASGLQHTA
jgi:hypothetical protein